MTPQTTLTFQIRRNTVLTSLISEGLPANFVPPTVSEFDACGFSVLNPEPDLEYSILIGDEEPEDPVGQDFGHIISWRHAPYFESARGRVTVQFRSRGIGSAQAWHLKKRFDVNVLPAKLGDQRYESMLEDLRAVSVGLVFDLVSKGRIGLGLSGIGTISSRPAHAELAVLNRLWTSVSYTLQRIAIQPMTGLQRIRERRATWGGEQMGKHGLRELAAAGIDPRRSDVPRPFHATRERVKETFDIPEHRVILGFLRFLLERTRDCERRAREHILAIEKEQPFRNIDQSDGSNLFRDVDVPKIERLRSARTRAHALGERISAAGQLPFLRGIRSAWRMPHGPIFANVVSYRRLRDEMLNYLSGSLAILDEGPQDRAKSTSRMYEQWLFLQFLAALRANGLSPESEDGLLSRSRRHRFTIDIERGTRVSFRSSSGRIVTVRYEPWIHPAKLARSLHDTVYRGRVGENSWCPDILIEFFKTAPSDGPPTVEYAIVIDAKYTSRVTARHQDVRKYNEIRSTADDHPVVKQVWLAHPSESPIEPWDEAVTWTHAGPDRPWIENVNGTLGVMPPSTSSADGTQSSVNEAVIDFVRAQLTYLQIVPQNHEGLPHNDS